MAPKPDRRGWRRHASEICTQTWRPRCLKPIHCKGPRLKKSGPLLLPAKLQTASPATADRPKVPVEVFPDDAAVTSMGKAIIVGVTAIAAVVIAPAGTNANTDADRTRADPHALRACRH